MRNDKLTLNNTLIIYAHPDVEGHNSQILKELLIKLTKSKIKYTLLDLYAVNYDPVLSKSELISKTNPDTKKFQSEIIAAKNIIFIYPIWWGTMPAILKGFIDRTFSSGFAFKYVNHFPVGLLKNKKAAVIITSGSPKILSMLFMGNRYHKSIKNDILKFCGIKSKVFHVDNALKVTPAQEKKITRSVNDVINWLY